MKELKCPKCGNVFSVDEADYALLLNQVKNAEFESELNRRLAEVQQTWESRQQAQALQAANNNQKALFEKDAQLQQKEAEIQQLKLQMAKADADKKVELQAALQAKDQQIIQLQSANALAAQQAELDKKSLKDDYETKLKAAQEQVDYYKDLKIRLSTKMVGETLEQHCYNEFTRVSPLFPNAEFHKDNEAVVGDDGRGTKGDFIFRDKSDDGVEYISIMFEMKNENDETATKHKNQDFFRKLDDDRKKKNCEYAVLVSMLEPENDLYNNGIVSVLQNDRGEKFEKMYVIRPQFFVPLITLLCQTSRKTIDTRRELALMKSQQVDVTHFEEKLTAFKDSFTRNVRLANDKFNTAIDEIDNTIKRLTKVREALVASGDYLDKADKKLEDVTVKRLTYGNPTMKVKFEEAGKQ